MESLSRATQQKLPPEVRAPNCHSTQIESGIAHIGFGACQGAHQAVYTDDALQAGDRRWGIMGASLRGGRADAVIPMRPDDIGKKVSPGYSCIGHLRGLAASRGVMRIVTQFRSGQVV